MIFNYIYIILLFLLLGCGSNEKETTSLSYEPTSTNDSADELIGSTPITDSTETQPTGPTSQSKFVYLTNSFFNTISKINLETFTLEKNIDAAKIPTHITASSDGIYIVVFDEDTGDLVFIDTKSDATATHSTSFSKINDLAITPDNSNIIILSSTHSYELIQLDASYHVDSSETFILDKTYTSVNVSNDTLVFLTDTGERTITSLVGNTIELQSLAFASDNSENSSPTSQPDNSQTFQPCSPTDHVIYHSNTNNLIANCGTTLQTIDLSKSTVTSEIKLVFAPETITTYNNETFYLYTSAQSSNNFLNMSFAEIDSPTTITSTIETIPSPSHMVKVFRSNEIDYINILSGNTLHIINTQSFSLSQKNISSHSLDLYEYKSDIFITHDDPLGLLTKITSLDSSTLSLSSLEGFYLTNWFDRF